MFPRVQVSHGSGDSRPATLAEPSRRTTSDTTLRRRLPPDPYSGDPFGYSAERKLVWSAGPRGKTDGTSHLRDADGSLFEWVIELP